MENKIAVLPEATIHYKFGGKGFPVLLLHGFGEDQHIWQQQVEFLKAHFTIITVDLAGTGQSAYTGKDRVLTMESMAEDVRLILEQEHITKCILLGHSMGGYVTLAFAELFPAYLAGFGLVHSTAYADNDEKKKNRLRGIEVIEEYGAYAFLKNTIPNLFGNAFKKAAPEIINDLIEKSRAFSRKSLQDYYLAMMNRPNRNSVLSYTTKPACIIAGTEDSAAPLTDLLAQSKLSPLITLHVLDGVGHMGMLEAAAEINKLLFNFIQSAAVYH